MESELRKNPPNLSVAFLSRELPSPLVLASGIWGTTVSLLERAAAEGCGAVTAKSCGPEPREGHVNPSCIDWGGGLLNAIGLANPGVDEEVGLLKEAKTRLNPRGIAVIASVFAGTASEFGDVARRIASANPDFLEINISCPNVEDSFGEPFAASADSTAEVTGYVKEAVASRAIPVIVKLAPNVPSVGRIAQAAVYAGADALCAINTMPGLVLDPYSGQPVLANRSGGVSGPALKPIALKAVYDTRKACPNTPIIGTGGVSDGQDAVEMLMAGATVVGVGSAIYQRGADAIRFIRTELQEWMAAQNITCIADLQDRAHSEPLYETSPSTPPAPSAE
ncbi:MAG: dihydroorotate dehydrogenase [Caldilineaceae bacterium SB0664_bin_27]|uniref:Dihydroorotate dehydrogenase n=1 Tax=Caldilineaceae bacterium SB0664_bin_27 TaxID=2605260 RepID=A0A6B0YTP0_9CHLR|nr:dihydroorotate dehydrogenase [Caldilineaceae bacterium SB0664_bin_27]